MRNNLVVSGVNLDTNEGTIKEKMNNMLDTELDLTINMSKAYIIN